MAFDGRPLDDDEAAQVFRRAAMLDVELSASTGEWDVARLVEVGEEVGIHPEAVRRAAAEVRLGAAGDAVPAPAVRTVRIVPAGPAAAQEQLAAWLREQLFEALRDRPGLVVAGRRDDEDARRRRRRDDGHRYRLGAVSRIAVAVAAVPGGGSALRVEAQLAAGRLRRAVVSGTAAAAGGLLLAGAVAAGTPVGIDDLPVVVPIVAGGAWGYVRSGRDYDRDVAEVALAVDGAIDRLER